MGQDLWRIVQDQESYYEKIDGLDYDEAFELNVLIEKGKPLLEDGLESWDELIYTPFRYPLPVGVNFGSRFKAPESEFNFLYAASEKDTSFAETAHHFLLERMHLTGLEDEIVKKTLFSFDLVATDNLENISDHPDIKSIMSEDYSHSFHFASKVMVDATGIIYPSARKENGINFAIKEIKLLGKEVKFKESMAYKYMAVSNQIEVSKYLGEKIFEYQAQNIF